MNTKEPKYLQSLLDKVQGNRPAMRAILGAMLSADKDIPKRFCDQYLQQRLPADAQTSADSYESEKNAFYAGMYQGFMFAQEVADYLHEDSAIEAMMLFQTALERDIKPAGRN